MKIKGEEINKSVLLAAVFIVWLSVDAFIAAGTAQALVTWVIGWLVCMFGRESTKGLALPAVFSAGLLLVLIIFMTL